MVPRFDRGHLVNPPDLQPAVAGILCLVLAGLHAAGSVAILRVLTLCHHHMARLAELEELERTLSGSETKSDSKRAEKAR